MANRRISKRKYESQMFPDILKAIQENKYTIAKPTGPKYKSEKTWTKWRQIFDEAEVLMKDFYFCIGCEAIYNIDIKNSGRCLKNHVDECFGKDDTHGDKIDVHFSPVFNPSKRRKISKEDKLAVKEATIKYIVCDMRPILSIKGNGLKSRENTGVFDGV